MKNRRQILKRAATGALVLVLLILILPALLAGDFASLSLLGFGFGAALTADRITPKKIPGEKAYPVKDATKIYAGSLVAIQVDGHAVPASDAANLKVVGVAKALADNTNGADGDINVVVETGIFRFVASSITQAMVGRMMYVVDDQTFDDGLGTNGVKAGKLMEFISTTEGWIKVEEGGVGSVIADADATYGQPEADLINDLKAIVNKWL